MLAAKMKQLNDKDFELTNKLNKLNKTAVATVTSSGGDTNTNTSTTSGSGKDRFGKKGQSDNKPGYEWKLKAPKAGNPEVINKDGKKFNWCIDHKKWVIHEP